jgi:tRNA pseudouridine55 synthase
MAKAPELASLPVYGANNPPDHDFDFQKGSIMLVNKPKSWTSFDVVKYLRGRVRCKKVGHAGTLDPMATGLLILCTGKATKTIDQIQGQQKTYIAEITFGGRTPSFDAESNIEEQAPFDHITKEKIQNVLNSNFSGEIMQVPPMYSALKRDGKKLYELARRGKEIELEARPITIYSTNIINYEASKLQIEITCSKGTYIRSIANDLGKALGSLGYLSALERTAIGKFSNANALTPHEYNDILRPNG